MKYVSNSSKLVAGSLAVAAILCLPVSSRAVTTTFTVNSSLSSLSLVTGSGIAGLPYTEQVTGSLSDFWGGTITADVTLGVITFTGGSAITALANPLAPFQPQPIGAFGGGIENYGAHAEGNVALLGGYAIVDGAYRNLTLDITAGTAQDTLAPSGMTLAFTGPSRLDYYVTSPGLTGPGSTNPFNSTGGNTSALAVAWDGTTLTLPVKFTTTGANGLVERWLGTVVATAQVPEPSSVALGLLGLGLFVACRARASQVKKS